MLKLGVMEPFTSSYASPVVVVQKPNASNIICVDFLEVE